MKNNKGFSLVELIVVISIMAILAAIAVVSFSIYIDKAHEANDIQYRTNLGRIAQLIATEHQIDLVEPVPESVVDGPEDIKLKVVDPVTGAIVEHIYDKNNESEYNDIILEIYNAVGDWTFSDACDHTKCSLVDSKSPTCTEPGYEKYDCGREVTYPQNPNNHVWGDKQWTDDGTAFSVQCTACGVLGQGHKDENGEFPIVSVVPQN
ncbi:MAG: type II secretion system protein [Ruminococcaceae bacterium]|nr:type II secretion system protein [Oscillospiraceae bacterium]